MSRRRHIKGSSNDQQRTASRLEVGGFYSTSNGDSYFIARRSQNGTVLVGVATDKQKRLKFRYFYDDGTAADSGPPAYWYTISGHGKWHRRSPAKAGVVESGDGRMASRRPCPEHGAKLLAHSSSVTPL